MGKLAIVSEFFRFVRERKKLWLVPIVVLLVMMGALFVITEGSVVAPFIYTLF